MNKVKDTVKKIFINEFCMCIVISFVLTLLIEILSRHSVKAGFSFMFYHVRYFMSNFAIILCTISPCLLFRRRYFLLSIVIMLWTALGVTNSVILTYRNTPLAAVDFSIIKSALDVMNAYVKPIQVVNIVTSVIVAIIVGVLVWRRAPKVEPKYKRGFVFLGATLIFCVGAMWSSYSIYKNPECFANLPEAYKNYGFAYCFSSSAVNRGVDKPADSGSCLAPFGIVGAPARHFPKLLHDIDGWVQLAPAVVILRRHIKERLVIQNDADDRRRGDGFRLCARILRILYICI